DGGDNRLKSLGHYTLRGVRETKEIFALTPCKDGGIGRRPVDSSRFWVLRLRLLVKRGLAFAASSIRRRSAAWTILLDWTFRSRRPASYLAAICLIGGFAARSFLSQVTQM